MTATASTSIQNFVTFEDTGAYSAGGYGSFTFYDASSGGAAIPNENAVIGWQSATLQTGSGENNTPYMNTVILDGPRSEYAIQVDGTGKMVINDISTGNATSGQSITVTGNAALMFGGFTSSGATGAQYFIENTSGSEIVALYKAALGRMPDLPGLEYWQTKYANGMTMEAMAQGFMNSSEFIANIINPTTSTDPQFVNALYQNVLNRAGDTGGVTYWLGQLASGESRADVLLGFTTSTENLNNISATNGGYLINTSHGGYADAANALPATTVLNQGISDNYINLANVGAGATGTSSNGNAILGMHGLPLLILQNETSMTIYASSTITMVNDTDTGDSVYSAAAGGTSIDFAIGNNSAYLSGTGNSVWVSSGNDQVFGFVTGDTLNLGVWGRSNATILTPSSSSPLQGSSLNFGSDFGGSKNINAVNVGAVGGGSLGEIATAANKVYVPADASDEAIVFFGQTSSGNTVLAYWGSSQVAQNTQADANGNHQVDAAEFTASITLVGVTSSSVTASQLHF